MKKYFQDHWRGRRSLFWSFWINLALLRLLILYAEQFTRPPFIDRSTLAIGLTALYFLAFHILVYSWQIRGLIKASDRYVSDFGSPIMAMASHFGIVISLLFTGFAVHDSYQSLFVEDRANSENQLSWNHSLLGEYTLTVDGNRIRLEGDLRVGVTEALKKALVQNVQVTGIILSSNGGRVNEGRNLAQLIQSRELDTIVFDECKSACTTAFIGGKTRILGFHGKLGFHQFSLDSIYYNPNVDPKSEQKIDLDYYARQGVTQAFLDEVFQATHQQMWFPEQEYLLSSGVVHRILHKSGQETAPVD
jgi:hypothetical protein